MMNGMPGHHQGPRRSLGRRPRLAFHPHLTFRRNMASALAAAFLITGCTDTSGLPPAPPAPESSEVRYVTPAYRIQVGDVLSIHVFLAPELNEDVTVRPDGHISTTLIADEMAADRTVPELTSVLTEGYKAYLRDPHMSVIVKTVAPIAVFVGGEVVQPGELLTAGTAPTLSQAISRAGGIKASGDDTNLFIVRRGPNDKPVFLSVRFDAVRLAQDPQADVRLAPFDVVMVPRLAIAEVYHWYNQYIQQFVTPSIGFSYVLNPTVGGQTILNPAH